VSKETKLPNKSKIGSGYIPMPKGYES
jgi:hypothetical protein